MRFSRVQFRRTFELATDTGYRTGCRCECRQTPVPAWVYDVEVGRGPIRSQPRRLRYDEYDIAKLLRTGRNVVAVLVTYYGSANSFWQPAASSGVTGRDAQLVLEARLGQAGQGEEDWLITDAGWRRALRGLARPGVGQSAGWVPIELLDARELDPAWTGLDFDDSAWGQAAVVRVSHLHAAGPATEVSLPLTVTRDPGTATS